ncbi:MAG: mycoredoxin [Candidatus Nanopelagicaceae bacterium]
MSFVMYSTTWCGYCKRLKSQLADLGISFEEINIEEVPGTAQIVEKVNGGNQTVPTLVFSDGSAMTNPSAKQVQEKNKYVDDANKLTDTELDKRVRKYTKKPK